MVLTVKNERGHYEHLNRYQAFIKVKIKTVASTGRHSSDNPTSYIRLKPSTASFFFIHHEKKLIRNYVKIFNPYTIEFVKRTSYFLNFGPVYS